MIALSEIGSLDPFISFQRETHTQSRINDVAKRCLLEFAVSLAIATFCSSFVATSAAMATIALGLVIQTIVNLILRLALQYSELPTGIKWLTAFVFAKHTAQNVQILVHEAGHANAVNAFLQSAKPTITLFPYVRGVTNWMGVKDLTWIGRTLSPQNIHPMIMGAGPFCTVAFSSFCLSVGLSKHKTSPEISRMLIVSALIDSLQLIRYALSALNAKPTNFFHDFVALWQLGSIHPYVAALTIAVIPAFLLIAYAYSEKGPSNN